MKKLQANRDFNLPQLIRRYDYLRTAIKTGDIIYISETSDRIFLDGGEYFVRNASIVSAIESNSTLVDTIAESDLGDTSAGGGGTGDVIGPATNTDSYIPQWNGANSKTLKNGVSLTTSISDPGVDTKVPTEKAVVDALAAQKSTTIVISDIIPGDDDTDTHIHLQLQISTTKTFASAAVDVESKTSQTNWYYDNGTIWTAITEDGVLAYYEYEQDAYGQMIKNPKGYTGYNFMYELSADLLSVATTYYYRWRQWDVEGAVYGRWHCGSLST